MKKLALFFTLAVGTVVCVHYAQGQAPLLAPPQFTLTEENTGPDMTTEQLQDRIFGALNFSSISSGYVLDVSLEGFESANYDGIGSDPFIESLSHWQYVYNSLYLSEVNGNANLSSPETIESLAEANTSGNEVALLFVNRAYHQMKTTAWGDGYFTLDADSLRLYDVPGKPGTPYEAKRAFVGGLWETEFETWEPITFKLVSGLFQTDGTFSGLQIDFGDGSGYRSVSIGQSIEVSYPSEGTKTIRFRQNTHGSTRTSSAQFVLTRPGIFQKVDEVWSLTSSWTYQGYRSQGLAEVYLGCGGVLDKAVVFVEGFDEEDGKRAEQLILDDFGPRGSINLYRNLYSLGYDMIALDMPGDFNFMPIQANALLLETLIDRLKSRGVSEIHIIGVSMGGLIARYCLADVESRGKDHRTVNYFSYDAPHQGANLQLGLQKVFRFMWNTRPLVRRDAGVKQLNTAFNSIAARQLLLFHEDTYPIIPAERVQFIQELQNLGYPTNTNNYGIANGALAGARQVDQSGVNLDYRDHIFDFEHKIILVDHFADAWLLNTPGVNAIVAHSKIRQGFSIFSVLRSSKTRVTVGDAYDIAPGGSLDFTGRFASRLVNDLPGHRQAFTNGRPWSNFVSVSSALDLNNTGFGPSSYPTNQLYSVNKTTILNNNITPFDDVWIGSANMPHTEVNNTISDWIYTKIVGSAPPNNPPCFEFCNNPLISLSGPDLVCNNSTITLSLNGDIPSSVYAWNEPSQLELVSGQGTPTAVYRAKSDYRNQQTVTLTVTNEDPTCQPLVYSKNVWIGRPIIHNEAFISGSSTVHCNSIYIYEFEGSHQGSTDTRWVVSAQFDNISSVNSQELFVDPTNGGDGYVTFVVSNSCGEDVLCKVVEVDGHTCGPDYINFPNPYSCGGFIIRPFSVNSSDNFTVYPNPSPESYSNVAKSSQEPLSVKDGSGETASRIEEGEPVHVDIYRGSDQRVVHSQDYNSIHFTIDTSSLEPGTYYYVVSQGDVREVKRLILE